MGQDAWNLMYGKRVNPKTRKGTEVDMHPDEGYGGPKMIPGYAGAYKNSKTKVLKANGNPKSYGSRKAIKGIHYKNENGVISSKPPKKRK